MPEGPLVLSVGQDMLTVLSNTYFHKLFSVILSNNVYRYFASLRSMTSTSSDNQVWLISCVDIKYLLSVAEHWYNKEKYLLHLFGLLVHRSHMIKQFIVVYLNLPDVPCMYLLIIKHYVREPKFLRRKPEHF